MSRCGTKTRVKLATSCKPPDALGRLDHEYALPGFSEIACADKTIVSCADDD